MSSLIQLRSVLEAIDSPRIVINPDLSVSFVNQAFTHAFGHSSLIGKHCYQLIFNQSAPCELCGAPGSVGNFVSRTIITGGQSSKVAHFLYGFSAGFGVCGGGGGGAHA